MYVDYKALGQRMKQYRKRKGMTQERLAERLDISVSYVSRVERGAVKVSLETLAKIAAVLEVSPADLLGGMAKNDFNYLNRELAEIVQNMDAEKIRLLTNIAKSIEEFKIPGGSEPS